MIMSKIHMKFLLQSMHMRKFTNDILNGRHGNYNGEKEKQRKKPIDACAKQAHEEFRQQGKHQTMVMASIVCYIGSLPLFFSETYPGF